MNEVFSEPVFWVFIGLATASILVGVWQHQRRKQAWITEAAARGLTYVDENGKKRPGHQIADPSEVEFVKSFSFRCLQRGYHQHVLMGRYDGKQVLIADYEEKKSPESLQTEMQQSSASLTYWRTVFGLRTKQANWPSLLLCRGREHADPLGWINDADLVSFPDDPAFNNLFTVVCKDPDGARAVLSDSMRAFLCDAVPARFHLELRGRDAVVHYGKRLHPRESAEQLKLLAAITEQAAEPA